MTKMTVLFLLIDDKSWRLEFYFRSCREKDDYLKVITMDKISSNDNAWPIIIRVPSFVSVEWPLISFRHRVLIGFRNNTTETVRWIENILSQIERCCEYWDQSFTDDHMLFIVTLYNTDCIHLRLLWKAILLQSSHPMCAMFKNFLPFLFNECVSEFRNKDSIFIAILYSFRNNEFSICLTCLRNEY